MADFPASPTIGEVYVVGGLNAICTGVSRFKLLPEHTTFSTILAMKDGILPANHRAEVVRYVDGGPLVPGLNYVSRGIGWPVVADGYVNHVDSKGNYLELQLTNDTISMSHTGADDTGIVDAAPHLRAAMARLGANGGGTLVIPEGTFYLNSGDPRGLKITGTPDFYTICEMFSNVTVRGFGDGSILRYNSNRIGVVPATGNGDAGVIFANFRVRAASNIPYYVTNFNVQDFRVDYTTLTNQSVEYIDGQVTRIWSNVSLSSGTFEAHNITVNRPAGQQVFSYERVDSFTSSKCRFFDMGKLANSSNTDVSLYYITGTRANIFSNFSSGSTANNDNATFIELHTLYSTVTDNNCVGMNTFMNAVSQVTHPSAFYDFSEFRVENNHVRNVRNFVIDWVAATNRKSLIHIKDNSVILRAQATNDVECLLRHAAITGPSDLPTESVVFEGNHVLVNPSGSGTSPVLYSTSFDALFRHQFVKDLRIVDNVFKNVRRGVVVADGVKLLKLSIEGNEMEFGFCGNTTNDDGGKVSRTCVTVNFEAGCLMQRINVKDNTMTSLFGGVVPNHGFFTLNSAGALSTVINIEDNNIIGTLGEELAAVVFGGNSHTSDSVRIQHRATTLIATGALASMFPNVGVGALFQGSKISYRDSDVIVSSVSGGNDFIIFSNGIAAPVAGYWSTGSWVHNTGAGVLGWKCDAAGTPGTWVAKG